MKLLNADCVFSRAGWLRFVQIISFNIIVSIVSLANAAQQHEATFSAAVIAGSTRFEAHDFAPLYRQQIGKPLSDELLGSIIDSIEEKYLDDGHFKPEIALSDRWYREGIIALHINESVIDSVRIEGSPGPYTDDVRHEVEQLMRQENVDRDAIRDFLRGFRRLPGLKVSAVLLQSPRSADARDLVLTVDFHAMESLMQVSNRGIEELGRNIAFGRVRFNSVFANADTVDLFGASSTSIDRYNGIGVMYGKLISDDGATFNMSVFSSTAEPHRPSANTPRKYSREQYLLRFRKPLIDTADASISLSVALRARNLQVDELGLQVRDERTRSLAVATRFAWRAAPAIVYSGDVELRRGIPGLGGRLDSGSSGPDDRDLDFHVFEIDVARVQRINDIWRLELGLAGQMTNHVLPSSERFKIGGEDYGRAYDLGELAGDRGVSGKVELGRRMHSSSTLR